MDRQRPPRLRKRAVFMRRHRSGKRLTARSRRLADAKALVGSACAP
jgi:hypothetical protein